MSGGGGGVIILKTLRTAAGLSVTANGRYKLWQLLLVTHAIAWAVGRWV